MIKYNFRYYHILTQYDKWIYFLFIFIITF